MSSNKGFEQWGEIFSDGIIATAILDRLLYHSEIFLLRGESYRMKGKMEKGGGKTNGQKIGGSGIGTSPHGLTLKHRLDSLGGGILVSITWGILNGQ